MKTDVSLYFTFIKTSILYLLLRVLVVDIYTAYVSQGGHYCETKLSSNEPCAYTFSGFNLKSAADQDKLNIIDLLNLAFTILSIAVFLIFRKQVFKVRDWLDFNEITQDDYTVLIENIPKFIFDDDTHKHDIGYYYELESKELSLIHI